MSGYPVTPQIKSYFDASGQPLNGYLYFGAPNENPETTAVAVYWDAALTKVAPQPIRVSGGFPRRNGVPANVFANGDFSCSVKDSKNRLVYTVPNSTDIQLALSIVGEDAAEDITVADSADWFSGTNVETVLAEIGAALDSIAAGGLPTGTVIDYCGTVVPSAAFVRANGRTISDTGGEGTERANADTEALYTQLWNLTNDNPLGKSSTLAVYSGGVEVDRQASAAADFADGRALALPDCRGRVRAGKDDMGNSVAGLLTSAGSGLDGTVLFNTGGTQTHTLLTAEIPSHTHTQNSHNHTQNSHNHTQNSHNHTQDAHTHTQNSHSHSYSVPSYAQQDTVSGSQVLYSLSTTGATTGSTTATNQNTTATNNAATATNIATTATNIAATATNQNTGGGGAHLNIQPTITFTVLIKL